MTESVEHVPYSLIELVPLPDETGDPKTVGDRWTWLVVVYPSGAVSRFGINIHDTRDEALAEARDAHPDLPVAE